MADLQKTGAPLCQRHLTVMTIDILSPEGELGAGEIAAAVAFMPSRRSPRIWRRPRYGNIVDDHEDVLTGQLQALDRVVTVTARHEVSVALAYAHGVSEGAEPPPNTLDLALRTTSLS